MKFISIRHKLVLVISLFIALMLAMIAMGTYHYFRQIATELILDNQFAMVSKMSEDLDSHLENAQKLLTTVAKGTPPAAVTNSSAAESWLQTHLGTRTIFTSTMFILDSKGVMQGAHPPRPKDYGASFADRDYFKLTMSSGTAQISKPIVSRQTQKPVIILTSPIRGTDGAIAGVLCGRVDLLERDNLLSALEKVNIGSKGYLYLFSTDRTMLMHPDPSRIMKQDVEPGVNKLFDRALEGFEGSGETINSRGMSFLVSFKHLHNTNWILAANFPLDEAYQPIYRFRNYFLAAMMALLVATIVLVRMLGFGVTRPLTAIIERITDLAQSGSDKRQRLDESRSDELGLLAVSFNMLMSDMQRRKQELSESEIRFRCLFEESPDAYTLISNGIFIDCNKAAEKLFQCGRQQFCGSTPEQFSPDFQPDGRPSSLAAADKIAEALRTGGNCFEWLHSHLDGSEFWAEVTLSSMELYGQTTLFSCLRDITERKKLEEELQEEKEYLNGIIDATKAGTWEWNIQTRQIAFNSYAADLIGYPLEEISPETLDSWKKRVHPDDMVICKELLRKHFSGELPYYDVEMRMKHKNGSWVWIINKGKVTRWTKEGEPLLMQGTHLDITARKEAEMTLRKLVRAIEQCPVTIAITDTDGTIEYVNPHFTELTGYSAEEAIGLNPRVLKSGQTPPEVFTDLWATITKGETWEGNFINKGKDGTLFWEHAVISALLDEKGVITHYLAVKEDVTEKKIIQEELISARDKAEAATLAKSQFLATMSHEIRTPMNGVIGMTGLLLETDLNEEQRGYAEIVSRSGENLLGLINDILDFSKIEAGRMDLEILNFYLRTTLEDTAELLTFRAQDAGLELICHIDPAVPEYLKGDPGRLRQIIINLAGNAIKFTHEGEVVIGAELASDRGESVTVRFYVRDTGIGIPQSRLAAVFEPFTQADGSTTRKYGGTGLGLAICKQLAELMGGEIGIESEVGKGSTFWFTAQFEKQTTAELQHNTPLLHADIKGTRILVVDDNATNRKLMDALLSHWECSYELAVDGMSALQKLREAAAANVPFQVALLDQEMPGMDGSELGRQIKADPLLQSTLLIMVTSLAQRGDAAALEKIGFVGYLPKPVKQAQLYSGIALVLDRARASETPSLITRHTVAEFATQTSDSLPIESRHDLRILLAEDNIINQKVAQNILGKLGYKADVVANGIEAVLALEMIDYDIVLMDCMMPEMDGYAATAVIRDAASRVRNHEVPIIAMTANAMQGDREKCLEAGMDDYLTKPVKKVELAVILEKWGDATIRAQTM